MFPNHFLKRWNAYGDFIVIKFLFIFDTSNLEVLSLIFHRLHSQIIRTNRTSTLSSIRKWIFTYVFCIERLQTYLITSSKLSPVLKLNISGYRLVIDEQTNESLINSVSRVVNRFQTSCVCIWYPSFCLCVDYLEQLQFP